VYHSTLALTVIKKKEKVEGSTVCEEQEGVEGGLKDPEPPHQLPPPLDQSFEEGIHLRGKARVSERERVRVCVSLCV